jgi:predicted amidophosphoribosyltransferase
LGLWLADAARGASWLDRVEAVVSVPTHWRRSLRWPVHAADALAAIVARDIRLPHLPVLHRIKAGPHQIGLSYLDRRRNVRGAFALRRGVALHGARLLLVDDVKTTGATINECAKILRQGGAGEVYAAVLVTVPPDRARLNASPGT